MEFKDEIKLNISMDGQSYAILLKQVPRKNGNYRIYGDVLDPDQIWVDIVKVTNLTTGQEYDESTDEGWDLLNELSVRNVEFREENLLKAFLK